MTSAAVTSATTSVRVDAADPVFAGHYPGFPIMPGLLVFDRVLDHVRTVLPGHHVVALDRAKFLRPVFPGDVLTIETESTEEEDQVRCAARVSTGAGPVAEFKLRLVTP